VSVTYTISQLAAFGATVTGMKNSYDENAIPDILTDGQLPCLLILPEVGVEQGYITLAQMGNAPKVTVFVTHLMLVQSTGKEPGVKRALPLITAALDNYLAAAKANPTLNTQAGPPLNQIFMSFSIAVGKTPWGSTVYHSIAFKHKFEIYL
jgi:hypothetical protein